MSGAESRWTRLRRTYEWRSAEVLLLTTLGIAAFYAFMEATGG